MKDLSLLSNALSRLSPKFTDKNFAIQYTKKSFILLSVLVILFIGIGLLFMYGIFIAALTLSNSPPIFFYVFFIPLILLMLFYFMSVYNTSFFELTRASLYSKNFDSLSPFSLFKKYLISKKTLRFFKLILVLYFSFGVLIFLLAYINIIPKDNPFSGLSDSFLNVISLLLSFFVSLIIYSFLIIIFSNKYKPGGIISDFSLAFALVKKHWLYLFLIIIINAVISGILLSSSFVLAITIIGIPISFILLLLTYCFVIPLLTYGLILYLAKKEKFL